MFESGGSSTQAGIYYQNSVAALALSDLLDFDLTTPRELVVEVRLEAPEHVDDIVVRYADGHLDYQSVKLNLRLGSAAWDKLWQDLVAQRADPAFGPADQLTIVVSERNSASDAVTGLCARAAGSVNSAELMDRLEQDQARALTSITTLVGDDAATFELLRMVRVLYQPESEIEAAFGRKRLAGGATSPTILPILRDVAGGSSRRRALFRAAPLRRRLKTEFQLLLPEPSGWGLDTYRAMVRSLARIEIPGTSISDTTDRLFVWPRTKSFDPNQQTDFEDEAIELFEDEGEQAFDLRAFPTDQFDKLVVVAGPGHGKSALLTAISGKLADGPLVPVLIPLASLSASEGNILEFLSATTSKEFEVNPDWKRLAEQGLLVLLLDGLDEVPAANRTALMRRLATFSLRFPTAPWILTVRDAGVLNGVPEATLLELQPLNETDIEGFAEVMRDHIGDIKPWALARTLKLYPDLDRLARIPLFLMLLLATTDLNDPKPLTRADLIEGYLTTLFDPSRHKVTSGSSADAVRLRAIAETLAFERLEKQQIGASEREVREVISRFETTAETAETLLERLRTQGILKPQGPVRFQFPYPIVQEYLAARHLVDKFPESLARRIDDAVQRPWAQVIQFALELHSDPEPIIRAMLARKDDAFATGLRLVGRCVANGAVVGEALRIEIGERLVDFWIDAPSRSRERVGRLLADGFANMVSDKLEAALHHRHLLENGAGDILTRRQDSALTLSVLQTLLDDPSYHMGIYHSFKYALRAAGDAAFELIVAAMDPDGSDAETIDDLSGIFWNFTPESVTRAKPLAVARDARLPRQARLRAYRVVGSPLEDDGIELARAAFRDADWNRNYAASDLIELHPDPSSFLDALLRDPAIALLRRRELAAYAPAFIENAEARAALTDGLIEDVTLDASVRIVLRMLEARHGNRRIFEALLADIPALPAEDVATIITLFGYYPDRALSERAVELIRGRTPDSEERVRIANAAHIGMHYQIEMDVGLGGTMRAVPQHPGINAWIELLEDWSEMPDLDARAQLSVVTNAARLGSEPMQRELEHSLMAVRDFDAPVWCEDDALGHTISSAVRQLRRKLPVFPDALLDRLLQSTRYNVAMNAVSALLARGNREALLRLIDVHASDAEYMLRDLAANSIELLAARLDLVVEKSGERYRLA